MFYPSIFFIKKLKKKDIDDASSTTRNSIATKVTKKLEVVFLPKIFIFNSFFSKHLQNLPKPIKQPKTIPKIV